MLPALCGSARTTACRQIQPGTETPTELLGWGSVKGSLTQGRWQMWEGSCPFSDHGTCGGVHLSQWPFKAWVHGTKVGWNMELPVHHPGCSMRNMQSRIIILCSSFQPFLGVCWIHFSAWLWFTDLWILLQNISTYISSPTKAFG